MNSPTGESLLKTPEGKAFLVIAACVLGFGGFYFMGVILPFVMHVLSMAFISLWYLIGIALTLGAIVWAATSKQLHCILWNAYKIAMRGFINWFIPIAPISILWNGIDQKKGYKQEFDKKRVKLTGSVEQLNNEITSDKKALNDLLARANAANQQATKMRSGQTKAQNAGDAMSAKQLSMQAENMEKEARIAESDAANKRTSIEHLTPLLNKTSQMDDYLRRLSEALDEEIRKATNTVTEQERQYKIVKAACSAMASAQSVINGNPDQRALTEQTLQFLAEDMAKNLGNIKQIMEVTDKVLTASALDQGVAIDQGTALLDRYLRGEDVTAVADPEATHTQSYLEQNYMPASTIGQKSSVPALKSSNPNSATKSEWE